MPRGILNSLRAFALALSCGYAASPIAADELPTIPAFKGNIGITYLSNAPLLEFLAEHRRELVFIDAVFDMDVAMPYNYQLLGLCSPARAELSDDLCYIPPDMEALLDGEIGGRLIFLPVFLGDGDPDDSLDETGRLPADLIRCYDSLKIETDDNSMFHFSAGGTGIVSYTFKGFFDVFGRVRSDSLEFTLEPVSNPIVELRAKSGAL